MKRLFSILIFYSFIRDFTFQSFDDGTTLEPSTPSADCTNGFQNIKYFRAKPGPFNITLEWDPLNDPCVTGYKIYINSIEWGITDKNTLLIENLNACQTYNVSIASMSNNKIGIGVSNNIETTEPDSPLLIISNILINSLNGTLLVRWNISEKVSQCILTYNINIKDNTSFKKSFPSSITSVVILVPQLIPCNTFYFDITPISKTNISGKISSNTFTIPKKVTNSPKLKSMVSSKTNVSSIWEIDQYSQNMCSLTCLNVTCEALDSDNPYQEDWIIKMSTASIEITNFPNRPYLIPINIENLSQFTNYTCTATVLNSAGLSEIQTIKVQTLEEVPSKVNLAITNISSSGFIIKWEKPQRIPGIFFHYLLIIKSIKANHYVKPSCGFTTYIQKNLTELIYVFDKGYSDFVYNVSVSAIDSAGQGPETTIQVTTNISEPKPPENFKFKIKTKEISLLNYIVTAQINWTVPCYINGPLDIFVLTVENYPIENGNLMKVVIDYKINKNENESDINYSYNLSNLLPYNYYTIRLTTILKNNIKGGRIFTSFPTPMGYPPAPNILSIKNITNKSFTIKWDKPYGQILYYILDIKTIRPLHLVPDDCFVYNKTYLYKTNFTEFIFTKGHSNYEYLVNIAAQNEVGLGNRTVISVNTSQDVPEIVRDIKVALDYYDFINYTASATIEFLYPCNTNGPLKRFIIHYEGVREGFENHVERIITEETWGKISIKPEYVYTINITTQTGGFLSVSSNYTFETQPGVPLPNNKTTIPDSLKVSEDNVSFRFSKNLFNETNGKILYYAIYVTPKLASIENNFGFWDGTEETWPSNMDNFRVTKLFWNPFTTNDSVQIILSNSDGCDDETTFCITYLDSGKAYTLIIRAFTKSTYTGTAPVDFEIESALHTTLILSLCFGFFAGGILIIFIFIVYKKKRHLINKENSIQESSALPSSIPIKKFIENYNQLKENPALIKTEFSNLNILAREAQQQLETTSAELSENKSKNRYVNIKPYDFNRVKLNIDEDDDIASDYINASYITGYSGRVEYIATQGPLESTCKDFWRMIIQENVTIIAMLSQCSEESKGAQCYRYFPENRETITVGGNIKIKCLSELHFGVYCVKTFKIKKNGKQHTVTHMQFLEWPDHGVPIGTEHMLQFCQYIRDRIRSKEEIIVVHCSAGVGRTGTLIAIDLLLQTINDKKPLNIFKTVLELRKQRYNMVQTESQYFYVYTSIKDALGSPSIFSEIKRSSIKSNLLHNEIESPV